MHVHMHTNVILTNRKRTHAQSNYTNTKLEAWFKCVLRHPARKRSGPSLHPTRVGRGVHNFTQPSHQGSDCNLNVRYCLFVL